ncbi:MAG TPA: hypothetical protein VLC09_03385 [Polyangiaceae bacterium]|nr:hypothetical protein [Polyangiaceae bacterium]
MPARSRRTPPILRSFRGQSGLSIVLGCVSLLVACQKPSGDAPAASDGKAPSNASTPQAHPAHEIVHVPVGSFKSGSLPGEPGRRPEREPLVDELELGPFRIDPLPYPGRPGEPPRLGATLGEATALCAERQGRLCTELEWERACKGPSSSTYPSGSDPCPANSCTSGFEVGELTRRPEWTASTLRGDGGKEGDPVVRGAAASLAPAERRCAHRSLASEVPASELAFRCCYGAPNALRVTEPTLAEPYKEVDVSLEELARLLKSDPATEALAEKATFFRSPDGARTVLDRGPKDTQGFTLTTRPLEWRPDRGLALLVLAGRSGEKTSFVVAYHLAGDRKILAGSFIMKNEPGPVALAYAPSIRPRVHFSTCWGCPGETGKILFRAPEDFAFLQP